MLPGRMDSGRSRPAAVLQEVRGEPGVRAEQEGTLAADVAGVQVRNGHGRGADGGLAVDLGVVLGGEGLVCAAEELAGDGESAVALAFRNAGRLQQVQGAAAGADEHELGVDAAAFPGSRVLERKVPAAVGRSFDVR